MSAVPPGDLDPDGPAAPGSGIFGLECSERASRVVLVPVPFDATTSYGAGTAEGPGAILAASHQVDLYDIETGRPYEPGIHMRPIPEDLRALSKAARRDAVPVIEAGGDTRGRPDLEASRQRVNEACETMNRYVCGAVHELLTAQKIVGVVGGDHSVALGSLVAHGERFPRLGVLQIDAHADLRSAYEGFVYSHASVMERALARVPSIERLVQVGLRDVGGGEVETIRASGGRIAAFFDHELARARLCGTLLDTFDRVVAALPPAVYVSVDIDGLNPRLCPGTGTPVPGGLEFAELSFLLGAVARSGRRIVGFDLCEVAPRRADPNDEWDANVGARVLYKLIGWSLHSLGISGPA